MECIGVGLVAVVAVVVLYLAFQQGGARDEAWNSAALDLGLAFRQGSLMTSSTISGTLDGLEVCVDNHHVNKKTYTRFVVGSGSGLDSSLCIRRESTWTGFTKALTGEDVLIHDAEFDERVHLSGTEERVVALMDHRTRKAVLDLVSLKATVSDGAVRYEEVGPIHDSARVAELVLAMVAAGSRLAVGESTQVALARNATEDPNPEVRLRNLKLLEQGYARSGQAQAAARRALGDPDPRLRLAAAGLVADGEAFAVAENLATDPSAPDELRVLALELLVRQRPYSALGPALAKALSSPHQELHVVAVRAIGNAADARMQERVLELAAGADGPLAEAVAQALGQLGDAQVETTLVELLGHGSGGARTAAARALAKVGTVRAVEPLLQVANGGSNARETREAAREAVRSIQSRLGDAGAGRLSLAQQPESAGGLSLSAPGGGLSLQAEGEGAPPGPAPDKDRVG